MKSLDEIRADVDGWPDWKKAGFLPTKPVRKGRGRVLFAVEVGQIWLLDGKHFHVPPQRAGLKPHEFDVTRSEKDDLGRWTWVYPRGEGDDPVWTLDDFQRATLVKDAEDK